MSDDYLIVVDGLLKIVESMIDKFNYERKLKFSTSSSENWNAIVYYRTLTNRISSNNICIRRTDDTRGNIVAYFI